MIQVSCYMLHVTCHMIHLTSYVLRVTCYPLRVTCYTIHLYMQTCTCLTRRAAPWARGGASRAAPPPDVPPDRTAPPSTSTRPRPPPAPPPPPPLHLLPRLALEGGHGLPAQLLRGRRHLALRVIPRRLPTRPLVAPHTHIPHRTPRLVRLPPQHTPSPSVRGPALSQCEWLA